MSKVFTTSTVLFIALFGFYTALIWPANINMDFIEHQMTQLTGMLTLGYLSIVMLLSVKPKWLVSRFFKVSDMFKAHREFGIASSVSLISHWLLANDVTLTNWLFAGWMQDFGEELGEVILYLLLPFVALSLSRLFKQQWFKHIHHLGGIIFVIAAIHSILLLEVGPNQLLFSGVIVTLTLIGGVCAWLSLSKHAVPLLKVLLTKIEKARKLNWKQFRSIKLGSISTK